MWWRRAAGASTSLALLIPLLAAAGEQVHAFTDARGVLHLSNVPSDPRYRPLALLGSWRPDAVHAVDQLLLSIQAPHAVRTGDEFDVSLSVPGSTGARGSLDLRFDPRMLAFRDSTSDADAIGPGVLRLYVDPGLSGAYAALVRFVAIGPPDSRASLEALHLALETDEGEYLHAPAPQLVVVRIQSPAR